MNGPQLSIHPLVAGRPAAYTRRQRRKRHARFAAIQASQEEYDMSATTITRSFDHEHAEAFLARVASIIDAAAIASMISIGHRLALFDTMAGMPPAGSGEIAGKAGLSERYVREWLAVMTVGRIVTYDPQTATYQLPPAHAASLTRRGELGNMAVYGQFASLLGAVQDRVLECFRTGEGLHYHDYPDFHAIMAEDSGQTVTARLFDAILPLASGVIERLRTGIDVMDAGCGRGAALIAMAERFPSSRFLGYDMCFDAIACANAEIEARGLSNIRFETRDLTGYDEVAKFDFITTFDAVHDQKDPEGLLAALRRALRPNGIYLMQDIGGSARLENNMEFPMAAMLYAVSTTHCTPVSLGQGGEGLGTMWGWETAQDMLHKVGFRNVERHVLAHDPMNVWFVSRA
jgi:2-polyprenyl-3-methyl-5-hydroxy-6-metoxy-1,4-benzoquinol methylase